MTTIYTKPSCVQCDMTKRMFEKLGISYNTVDISEDQEAFDMLMGMGFRAAPVVITPDTSWAGFQPDRIAALAA